MQKSANPEKFFLGAPKKTSQGWINQIKWYTFELKYWYTFELI